MNALLSRLSSLINLKTLSNSTSSTSTPLPIIPTSKFVFQYLPLPDNLPKKDLPDLLSLHLESTSPFPLSDLSYGFIPSPSAAFLYATYSPFLFKNSSPPQPNPQIPLLPAFAFASPPPPPFSLSALKFQNQLSLISWDTSLNIPINIHVFALPHSPTLTTENLFSLAHSYAQEHNLSLAPSIQEIHSASLSPSGHILLQESLHSKSSSQSTSRKFSPPNLLNLDLRDKQLALKQNNQLKLNNLLTKSALATLSLLLLASLSHLALLASNAYLNSLSEKAKSQAPLVSSLESQDSLASKLESLKNPPTPPTTILQLLSSLKPKLLYFTNFSLSNSNQFSLQGLAATVEDANKFAAALKASKNFSNVSLSNIKTQQNNKISFQIKASYQS